MKIIVLSNIRLFKIYFCDSSRYFYSNSFGRTFFYCFAQLCRSIQLKEFYLMIKFVTTIFRYFYVKKSRRNSIKHLILQMDTIWRRNRLRLYYKKFVDLIRSLKCNFKLLYMLILYCFTRLYTMSIKSL